MKRNGLIEVLRFFFAAAILWHHSIKDFFPGYTLGFGGYCGVTFFFILSGYLLAKKCFSQQTISLEDSGTECLSSQTICFIFNKIKSLFFAHSFSFLIALLVFLDIKAKTLTGALNIILDSIPSYLFLHSCLGFKTVTIISVEWYLSAMFFAMMILYPLCRKYYLNFTRIIAPISGLLIFAWICHDKQDFGSYGTVGVWGSDCVFSVGFLRALSEISLGASLFEATRCLKSKWKQPIIFTALIISFFVTLYLILSNNISKLPALSLLSCATLVVTGFSSNIAKLDIFKAKFSFFLGVLSMHLYLAHRPVQRCLLHHFGVGSKTGFLLSIVISIALALCSFVAEQWFQEKRNLIRTQIA